VKLTGRESHLGWDNSIPPAVTVASGDTVEVELLDSSGGQLDPTSGADNLHGLDFGRLNPVTGPIAVDGAEPGDVLEIRIDELVTESWGWSASIPGFGLLADQFTEPHLVHSRIAAGMVELGFGPRLRHVPMIGTIGVAPAEIGELSIIPPRRWGGNLDVRHITAGSVLMLPVGVDGALLSLGDAHAAMGDGEVCGTGIEAAATTRLTLVVHKGRTLDYPRYITDPSSDRSGPAVAATGIGPDLMKAARDATAGLIDEVVTRTGVAPVDAYILCSVAADLKISEIVDAPNWVVSAHLPIDVLES
jgi:acetamidase/formamidase